MKPDEVTLKVMQELAKDANGKGQMTIIFRDLDIKIDMMRIAVFNKKFNNGSYIKSILYKGGAHLSLTLDGEDYLESLKNRVESLPNENTANQVSNVQKTNSPLGIWKRRIIDTVRFMVPIGILIVGILAYVRGCK